MHLILGPGSFCTNDCVSAPQHGGNQPVALLRCSGSPNCFYRCSAHLHCYCIVTIWNSHPIISFCSSPNLAYCLGYSNRRTINPDAGGGRFNIWLIFFFFWKRSRKAYLSCEYRRRQSLLLGIFFPSFLTLRSLTYGSWCRSYS